MYKVIQPKEGTKLLFFRIKINLYIDGPFLVLMMMSAAMEELDGDDVRVSSRGRFAERDIVQV